MSHLSAMEIQAVHEAAAAAVSGRKVEWPDCPHFRCGYYAAGRSKHRVFTVGPNCRAEWTALHAECQQEFAAEVERIKEQNGNARVIDSRG